jgi:hypothetical protein
LQTCPTTDEQGIFRITDIGMKMESQFRKGAPVGGNLLGVDIGIRALAQRGSNLWYLQAAGSDSVLGLVSTKYIRTPLPTGARPYFHPSWCQWQLAWTIPRKLLNY